MRYKLIISQEVSRVIGSWGLERQALLTLLQTLREELESNYPRYRQLRDPTNPDLNFWCGFLVWDQGKPRGFRFVVDDTTAAGHLFIVAADEF